MEMTPPLLADEQESPFYDGQSETPRTLPLPRPAGFTRRAISYCMDSFIILILFLVLIFSGVMGMRFSGGMDAFFYTGSGDIFILSFLFIYTGYFTFFHAYEGQTPAKMIMRIKVVTREGASPSFVHALIRTVCFFLSHLFFGFGFLLTLLEPKKRALHDLLTGTQVVLSP